MLLGVSLQEDTRPGGADGLQREAGQTVRVRDLRPLNRSGGRSLRPQPARALCVSREDASRPRYG